MNGTTSQIWIVNNAPLLVQVVVSPVQCFASDYFQARKMIIIFDAGLAFIGAIIAPTSHTIGPLILGQVLIGFGLASTAIAYTVCSEILPRKWRPSKFG